jgi:tRNA U38,U39,U40 pseudouridine synthase TruA
MVRSVVGTLLHVGLNKITVEEFVDIINKKNRSEAGESVDARGLFLTKIEYPFI